jgi:hypothetical protein
MRVTSANRDGQYGHLENDQSAESRGFFQRHRSVTVANDRRINRA